MLVYSITHDILPSKTHMATVKAFLERHSAEFMPPLLSRKDFATILHRVRTRGGVFTVSSKGKPVSLIVYENEDTWAHIHYIVTASHERRKGRMRSALATALDELEYAYLETWSTNIAARSLFEKIGLRLEHLRRDARGKNIHELEYRYARR